MSETKSSIFFLYRKKIRDSDVNDTRISSPPRWKRRAMQQHMWFYQDDGMQLMSNEEEMRLSANAR